MVVTKILMTLPSNYAHFNTAWESMAEAQQTMIKLTQRLMMEEARLEIQGGYDEMNSNTALTAKRFRGQKSKGSNTKHATSAKKKVTEAQSKGNQDQSDPGRTVAGARQWSQDQPDTARTPAEEMHWNQDQSDIVKTIAGIYRRSGHYITCHILSEVVQQLREAQ